MADAGESQGGTGGRPRGGRSLEGGRISPAVPRQVDEDAGPLAGSLGRATLYGLGTATAGAAVHVVAAHLFLWTAGLLAIATAIAVFIGLAVVTGGGSSLAAWPRRSLAVVLAVGAIGAALLGNWALSGMYLGPVAYLAAVYGLLAPAQLVLAAAGALYATR
jgi:hypothetical protein